MCHGVRWVPNIWEFTETDGERKVTWPGWCLRLSQASHLLTVLSCSVNFYIYLVKHGRRELTTLARRTSPAPRTDSLAVSDNVSWVSCGGNLSKTYFGNQNLYLCFVS